MAATKSSDVVVDFFGGWFRSRFLAGRALNGSIGLLKKDWLT